MSIRHIVNMEVYCLNLCAKISFTSSRISLLQIGFLKLEKSIPDAILRQAKGLAIITVVKVGVGVTYNIGTGLVVARREDGSWSPPSAVSTFGVGWGAQVK